ncbi:MAG: type II toxin-antitoxin system ParD family antitoxin [Robiginitomaculum sp.]|nr:type II toxin-antitoxin system ParD family antitoxin [Robiginitomaculum sp.]
MATVRKSISLTKQQDDWVKAQISSGNYTNDSEVMRDLIRKAQLFDVNLQSLRAEVRKGRDSGAGTRTMDQIKVDVIARMKNNGQLPT